MRIHVTSRKSVSFLAGALLIGLVGGVVAQPLPDAKTYAANPALLIDAYRHVEVASVSDALEQLYNKRSFMTHRIHAISDGKIAGFAVTVQMDKAEGSAPSDRQSHDFCNIPTPSWRPRADKARRQPAGSSIRAR